MGYKVVIRPKIGVKMGYMTMPVKLTDEEREREELRICEEIATDVLSTGHDCYIKIERDDLDNNL